MGIDPMQLLAMAADRVGVERLLQATTVLEPPEESFAPSLAVLARLVIGSVVFALVGVIVFALAFWIITKVVPFSIRKEIEDDQNTSLGIVIGAVIIGLALIISSAIRG